MRSWIRADAAVTFFRVHVFVHLGERANEAESHDAAVATTVFREVVSLAHERAEVGNEDNYKDQECDEDNPGKAIDHVAKVTKKS